MDSIKLIAMDFDSTLLDHTDGGKYIPRRTIELLTALIRQGIPCGIDSGRESEALLDTLRLAGVAPGKPFPSFFMDQENFTYWNEGEPAGQEFGWDKEGIFAAQPDNGPTKELLDTFCRRISGHIPAIMALIEQHNLPVDHWVVYSGLGMVVYFAANEAAQTAIELAKPFFANDPGVLLHRNVSILHIVPQNSGKGPSLLRAAQYKGLQPQQVLAIGDSLNDLSMLDGRCGFISACVGNADDIVKEAVRSNNGYIAKGRAGEGVYEILQHFIAQGMLPNAK